MDERNKKRKSSMVQFQLLVTCCAIGFGEIKRDVKVLDIFTSWGWDSTSAKSKCLEVKGQSLASSYVKAGAWAHRPLKEIWKNGGETKVSVPGCNKTQGKLENIGFLCTYEEEILYYAHGWSLACDSRMGHVNRE